MSSRDQLNRGEKPGLVWRNRKKISQIINDYIYLPFFLWIILCLKLLRSPRIDSKEPIPAGCVASQAGKVKQPYSYLVPSPHRLSKNSSTVLSDPLLHVGIKETSIIFPLGVNTAFYKLKFPNGEYGEPTKTFFMVTQIVWRIIKLIFYVVYNNMNMINDDKERSIVEQSVEWMA